MIGGIQDKDGKNESANRVDNGQVRAEDEDDGWYKYTNRRQKITQYVQTGGSQVDIRFLWRYWSICVMPVVCYSAKKKLTCLAERLVAPSSSPRWCWWLSSLECIWAWSCSWPWSWLWPPWLCPCPPNTTAKLHIHSLKKCKHRVVKQPYVKKMLNLHNIDNHTNWSSQAHLIVWLDNPFNLYFPVKMAINLPTFHWWVRDCVDVQ